ncbi:hypothetical protein NSP_32610 [Nodularia spumigena CCY9414]|nr:hypothetical protein NSP_32610 [Nodularia spumigena CCY9414]
MGDATLNDIHSIVENCRVEVHLTGDFQQLSAFFQPHYLSLW